MTAAYDIALAAPDDVPSILALQESNLLSNRGALSVRLPVDWFERAMRDMPLIVARRDGKLVGYMVATTFAAQLHIPIIQALLRNFPAPPGCYNYGPVCVAESERGNGLAATMFENLCAHLPGRAAMTFIRADNAPSRRAHLKMGMRELGPFTNDGVSYIACIYEA
jgi:predicted GNAT superfamily acetyltransferase